ncbi:unnamed protein product [Sphenostylis stenocarpa]|uniref:Uncharacterized protein n=1 Tax=Sphenostylis stenocarpa TaxID=92480 RepID=A0AA86RYE1_9FABA|nr:unnamed protein product [Sphenostylis stenocarpa]
MANWRKQQGESHHQVGHWRSSSNSRKPPLDNYHPSVPAWERKFCSSIGSVPWGKIVKTKHYMHLFDNVANWDDSAGKEAFENAKMRYWADINGIHCNISLPDPDIYIDDVDWNAIVDPELMLELEREALRTPVNGIKNDQDVVIIGGALYLNDQMLPCTGWGDDEEDQPKSLGPTTAPTDWGTRLHENNGVESGQQLLAPAEPAKELEWQGWRNDSWGWNHREHYGGGDMNKMGRGRNGGGYGNWGTWDGHNRRRENNAWCKTPPTYNGNSNENVYRGRRNYRGGGGRKGNLVYVPKEMPPTPAAW